MADAKATSDEHSALSIPPELKPLFEGGFKRLPRMEGSQVLPLCPVRLLPVKLRWRFKEGKESKIDLDDDDPQVVEALIHCLYNFDYGEYTNRQTDVSPLVLDVRMFVIADKYFVEPLKELAAQKFEARTKTEWSLPAFAEAIKEAYDTTADDSNPLRRIIISSVKEHSNELLQGSGGHNEFLKVLHTTAEFGAEVSVALATTSPHNSYRCTSCSIVIYCDIVDNTGYSYYCPVGHCYNGSVWASNKVGKV